MANDSEVLDLSIVVPAFNEALELPALLRSLESVQSSLRCEVIVVDNGSTDDTAAVARSFNAKVVRSERATVANARNVGTAVATGKLVAFLDADIVVTDSWTNEVVRLAKTEQLGREITGDVCDIGVMPSWLEKVWFQPMYRRGAGKYLNSGNLLVRRSDFLEVGGFNAGLVTGEDVDFCVRATGKGIAVVARRALHVYHNGYPRTLAGFFRREAWHGRGDFSSWRIFSKSKVSQVAMLIVALHVIGIIALFVRSNWVAVFAFSGVAAICFASSVWKWRRESLRLWFANAFVFYFYYMGRAWSAILQLRNRK
jgi:glycosyltransferase involved in cell wall biosynthesis